MAKWNMGVNNTGDRFFFGMFDKVTYLVPLENRDNWTTWIGSNSPDVPEYATICPGTFEMSFAAPRPFE